jgi:hypothetical protein
MITGLLLVVGMPLSSITSSVGLFDSQYPGAVFDHRHIGTRVANRTMDKGFLPLAAPTARDALGEPMTLAKSR